MDLSCTQTKLFHYLLLLFKQAGVQLWVTAFSEVAQALVGKSVEKLNSLDQTEQKTAVDDVIGSECLACIVKHVKGRFTNYVIDHTIMRSSKRTFLLLCLNEHLFPFSQCSAWTRCCCPCQRLYWTLPKPTLCLRLFTPTPFKSHLTN